MANTANTSESEPRRPVRSGAPPATAAVPVPPGNRAAVAASLALAVLVTGAALGWLAERALVATTERLVREGLRAELGARRERLLDYLERAAQDHEVVASSRISRDIVAEFADALAAVGENAYADVRRAYLFDNPTPPGSRQALLSAPGGGPYDAVHARYHDWLLRFATNHDHYDLSLADADGNVVHSVYKEDDFGTSLVDGPYRSCSPRSSARCSRSPSAGSSPTAPSRFRTPPSSPEPAPAGSRGTGAGGADGARLRGARSRAARRRGRPGGRGPGARAAASAPPAGA